MPVGAYNAVRVGDLEVAMVLARELRAAGGRPVLTLAQLQAVFGATHLDTAERERIDAALDAAGMRAEPSVLDAHPEEALTLRVGGNGAARRFARAAAAPASTAAAAPPRPLPVAAIVTGLLAPVLLASVAGWRFGLSFVAFTAIAAGFLAARAEPAEVLRDGRTFLIAVGGLCALSLLASVALAGAGATKSRSAAHSAPPKPAPRPVVVPRTAPPAPAPGKKRRTHRVRAPKPPTPATPSTTP